MQPSVVKGYKSIACKLLRRGWMEHAADITYLMQRLRPPIVQGASMRWDDQPWEAKIGCDEVAWNGKAIHVVRR